MTRIRWVILSFAFYWDWPYSSIKLLNIPIDELFLSWNLGAIITHMNQTHWPKTLDEALKICLLTMTNTEKKAIKNTSEDI
jgi:hypothetical protein